jgi:hypothetical protein
MMRRCSTFLVTILLFFVATPVFAHDGSWGTVTDPCSIISWDSALFGHNDAPDWKGTATLTVSNSMSEQWGDFHFSIYEITNPGTVIFTTAGPIEMLDSLGNPYAGGLGVGYNYTLTTSQTLDFTFYSNPVNPGQIVTFKVYTDNTSMQNAWFGLTAYPTPVPEPATIALLGLGILSVMRKRRS